MKFPDNSSMFANFTLKKSYSHSRNLNEDKNMFTVIMWLQVFALHLQEFAHDQ